MPFDKSITEYLQRFGLDTRPPTSFVSDEDRIIPSGARNETLTALAGMLRKMRVAPNMIRAMLIRIGTDPTCVESPMTEAEVDHIFEEIGHRSSRPFDTFAYTVSTVTPNDPVSELEWLIPGFLPNEGLILLYGRPAQGKSWVAMLAALCAMGKAKWVDGQTLNIRPRRVAYFDWERRGSMFKRRLKRIVRGMGTSSDIAIDYIECRKPLGEMIEDIRELVLVRGYEFVVIDSLSIAIMTADLTAAHEIIPRLFALHELGIPILLLDHQKKAQGGENPHDGGSAFGSMFKEAIVSFAWQAIKVDPSRNTPGHMDFRLHHKKNNFDIAPEHLELRLVLDDENDLVRIEPLETTPLAAQIIDAIEHRPEGMTVAELASVTGVSTWTVRRNLEDPGGLIEQGIVRILRKGGDGRGNSTIYAIVNDWQNSERPA